MAIKEHKQGRTVVLEPDSDITWKTQPELKQALDGLSSEGRRHIVIDLTHVREISGYGLGLLASRCGRLRRQHGDIKLVHTSEPVRRLLQVTRLEPLFEQFDTTAGAVRSFSIIDRGDSHESNSEE
jgi:anti-anti-sigma factor